MRRVRISVLAMSMSVCLALAAALLGPLGATPKASAQSDGSQGTVTMEWLGHMFFRFTSPRGVVVMTSPWLLNPDSPLTLDEVDRADILLVPNGHPDDQGNALEIGIKTGARVLAPGALARWMVDNGLSAAQAPSTGPGNLHNFDGILVRVVHNLHDNNNNRAEGQPYGGPALGYIVTFENGFTVYFAGSSAITMDMQLYGSLYKPHLALLHLGPDRDPMDFANMTRLLLTDNPNLQAVVPMHMRAGAPQIQRAAQALQSLDLPVRILTPAVLEPLRF
jgi:L-ascorbate metabolism protein UlaG (beta-lactamase superfamily)